MSRDAKARILVVVDTWGFFLIFSIRYFEQRHNITP